MVAHKRHTNDLIFKLYDKPIEIVNNFCYLGIVINNKGNFNNAIDRLYNKAFKAHMSLRQQFNFYNGTSVKTMLKLYESMVQSTLLYGSELWGIFGWRSNEYNCIRNYILSKKQKYEMFHSKFCKSVLGLNKQTPDLLAKAELGRYPLMSCIIKRTYSYWQHILASKETSLLYKALQVNIDLDRKGSITYYSRIKGMLSVLNAKNKIYPVDKTLVKREAKNITSRYQRLYEEDFFKMLKTRIETDTMGKYTIYCKVKKIYKCEKYLHSVKDNTLRRHVTGLRCASNLMPVNYMRKFNVNRNNRYCTLCSNNDLGTEMHIIMRCKNEALLKQRKCLYQLLYKCSPQLELLSDEDLFTYLSACIEPEITCYFAVFLDKIHKLLKKCKPSK